MIITQADQLESFCKQIRKSNVIAVDTEFKRESTYYPQLCLIQIADKDQFGIIDAIILKDLSPLNIIFQNIKIIKLLHSSKQDLEIFFNIFKELPKNMFDTQIAASVIGLRQQISFKDLVSHYLNVELDKKETRSDWSKRPLSNKQLKYAQYDVTYLIKCYELIVNDLKKLKRLNWPKGDFKQLEKKSNLLVDNTILWKKVKGHQNLKNNQLQLLNNLAIWREYIAQKDDIPRRKAINDNNLINIIQSSDEQTSNEQIRTLPETLSKSKYSKKLQDILEENIPCQIKNYQPIKLNQNEKVLFNKCLEFITQKSEELNIDIKSYISNNKIKQFIKLTVSNPCLKTNAPNWLDYAINIPLAVFICDNIKIE